MSLPTLPTCMQSGRRMGPGERDTTSRSLIQKVRIHSELQIPAGCDSMSIYKSLKHTLQDAYRFSLWFDVKFEGLATQLWKFEARLNIGATMVYRSFRSKFRAQILDSFRANLSPDQFQSFQTTFNGNRKALQIEEDVAPFTEDKPHSWTRDGLPDIEDVAMNALLPDRPAAASTPAPGGATQLTSASVSGSASISTLPPAGSRLPDGSSGPATPPASPPRTGLRRSRPSASPPAPDKPGHPGSANKTALKTLRASEASRAAASRGLPFGAGGPTERSEPAGRGGPGDPSTSTPAPPSAGAAAVAPAETGQGLPVGRGPAAIDQPPADGSRPAAAAWGVRQRRGWRRHRRRRHRRSIAIRPLPANRRRMEAGRPRRSLPRRRHSGCLPDSICRSRNRILWRHLQRCLQLLPGPGTRRGHMQRLRPNPLLIRFVDLMDCVEAMRFPSGLCFGSPSNGRPERLQRQ
jgi:hypothetical protein